MAMHSPARLQLTLVGGLGRRWVTGVLMFMLVIRRKADLDQLMIPHGLDASSRAAGGPPSCSNSMRCPITPQLLRKAPRTVASRCSSSSTSTTQSIEELKAQVDSLASVVQAQQREKGGL